MRTALICYHKNVTTVYKPEWIAQYRQSVLSQTYQHFDIYELNYGGSQERIFDNSIFVSHPFKTFVHGMNYLLSQLFFPPDNPGKYYDCVFNSNVDDYYHSGWIEKELFHIENGYDIVSSNYMLIKDDKHLLATNFDASDINNKLNNQENIVAHPAVAYSRHFWQHNRYKPEEIPYEDLRLWQRSIVHFKFLIIPEILLFYRQHPNSVCQNPANR